jgi:hypothetical protein
VKLYLEALALALLAAELTTTAVGTSTDNTTADKEGGDTIVVQSIQPVKHNRGRPYKYPLDPTDITIFL